MVERSASSPARVLLIANPIAGSGRGERLARELARELEAAQVRVDLRLTGARGDAQRFAAGAEGDAVISVGGDGTLSEILRGLRDPHIPIGILPLGTANVLARDLHLRSDPRRAAALVLGGRTAELDTALVNGRLSFLAASVGFDAQAVHAVEERRRGPIHKLTYAGACFRALGSYREPELEVEVDGARVPGTFGWVLVSNVVHYGGVFRLAADRALDDGLWEVYLFERAARRHLAEYAVRGLLGRLPGGRAGLRRARHVRVRSSSPVAAQADGDACGATPLEIDVSGPRFRIFCPAVHATDRDKMAVR